MPFLLADSIGKSFGGRRILNAGTLRASVGDIRVVFGRNGIGKSTLIKIAAGVIAADTGIVRVNEVTVLKPSLASMARAGVFYLPDHDLFSGTFTLAQQLEFFERRYEQRSAIEAAAIANVQHLLPRKPQSLSGGELRRAELAAALTRKPKCLLADEPYRGIAPIDHGALTDIFRVMASDGCAVVVTGHEVPSLMELATHITWCTSGTTYELGTPDTARNHEAFVREYLSRKG
ncbi:MAG: ATP-binding cassette domain-containing protein [Gemmatimonadaceae bacterium]